MPLASSRWGASFAQAAGSPTGKCRRWTSSSRRPQVAPLSSPCTSNPRPDLLYLASPELQETVVGSPSSTCRCSARHRLPKTSRRSSSSVPPRPTAKNCRSSASPLLSLPPPIFPPLLSDSYLSVFVLFSAGAWLRPHRIPPP
ncbi:hypothetical protein ZWY2020_025329 [Hordeum vulgare]|nr:hypothetical protein ZWY2020_025329 [Hordeum vulgare]